MALTLKILKQVLKGFGDDSRLRIINLLSHKELTVNEICAVLEMNQPSVSKNLVKLRMLKIVNDRRDGNFIYYSHNDDPEITMLTRFLVSNFKNLGQFVEDKKKFDELSL
ncbi:MAG: metalloregulator ArsR/SmtB family transcription factor [Candidatus Omnitrophota bacterium]